MPAQGFADLKTRTDLRLARTKDFDVDLTGFRESVADGLEREFGRIAIATEMTQHNTVDFSRQKFFNYRGCGVVG